MTDTAGELAAVVNGARQWAIVTTDVLAGLRAMPDACVQLAICSPPYIGLRSYSTQPQIWGGDPFCSHTLGEDPARRPMTGGTGPASAKQVTNNGSQFGNASVEETLYGEIRTGLGLADSPASTRGGAKKVQTIPKLVINRATCTLCGAWRGELGSEPTPDCGRSGKSDDLELRGDLTDEERVYVIGELVRLGVVR